MIKYLTLNYHYHESIYEFSNISATGIFEIKKALAYRVYFDQDSWFPLVEETMNVEEALIYLSSICTAKVNDEMAEVRSITKLILQQK